MKRVQAGPEAGVEARERSGEMGAVGPEVGRAAWGAAVGRGEEGEGVVWVVGAWAGAGAGVAGAGAGGWGATGPSVCRGEGVRGGGAERCRGKLHDGVDRDRVAGGHDGARGRRRDGGRLDHREVGGHRPGKGGAGVGGGQGLGVQRGTGAVATVACSSTWQ